MRRLPARDVRWCSCGGWIGGCHPAEVDVDSPNADGIVAARMLAEFGAAIPRDNYEGLAVTEDADGMHLWLISDDNFMSFQRTMLLKLRWQPREKARE